MADADVSKPRKKILCRDAQIETLKNFIGSPWEVFPHCILLLGRADTGKTLTIEEVIRGFKWKYRIARIDCCSCTSLQALFTTMLDQIVRHKVSAQNGYKSHFRVDNMNTFVDELKKAAHDRTEKTFKNKKIFIILDHSEHLMTLNPQLPDFFVRLRELTKLHTTVLMTLNKMPNNAWFHSPPLEIRFPQYTKHEMVTILSSERPEEYHDVEDAYANYVKMMVDILFNVCRQLGPIQCQLATHAGTAMHGDLAAKPMWKRLRAVVDSAQPTAMGVIGDRTHHSAVSLGSSEALPGVAMAHNLDLPFCSKFLLIAALLAAHLPPAADAKLFVRARPERGKRKASRRRTVPSASSARMLLGPRSFPVDRLFAIFYAIVADPLPLTVQLQTQVSSLIKLELLRDVSADPLAERKLACTASSDMIIALARTVDFELEKYMSLADVKMESA